MQQQVDTQARGAQPQGDGADAAHGTQQNVEGQKTRGNHGRNELESGFTWLACTPKVGKRRWRRGKRRTQTQSLLSSTLTT